MITPRWRLGFAVAAVYALWSAGLTMAASRPLASSRPDLDVSSRAVKQTPGPCPDGDYTLSDYALVEHGQMEGVAWFALRGPYTCRLATQLKLVVQPGGTAAKPTLSLTTAVAGLRGNPAQIDVDAVLRPGEVVARSWRWENWCGKSGKFAFLARAGSTRTSPGHHRPSTHPHVLHRPRRQPLPARTFTSRLAQVPIIDSASTRGRDSSDSYLRFSGPPCATPRHVSSTPP